MHWIAVISNAKQCLCHATLKSFFLQHCSFNKHPTNLHSFRKRLNLCMGTCSHNVNSLISSEVNRQDGCLARAIWLGLAVWSIGLWFAKPTCFTLSHNEGEHKSGWNLPTWLNPIFIYSLSLSLALTWAHTGKLIRVGTAAADPFY